MGLINHGAHVVEGDGGEGVARASQTKYTKDTRALVVIRSWRAGMVARLVSSRTREVVREVVREGWMGDGILE